MANQVIYSDWYWRPVIELERTFALGFWWDWNDIDRALGLVIGIFRPGIRWERNITHIGRRIA